MRAPLGHNYTFSDARGLYNGDEGRMFAWALNGKDIDGSSVSCTGSQIASVLDLLKSADVLHSATWYAGGLDVIGGPQFHDHSADRLSIVPNLSDLIAAVRLTPQLMDGIFLASDAATASSLSEAKLISGRPIGRLSESSIVEVVAFDTSWIEIYSDLGEVIDLLQNRDGGRSLSPLLT
jgi:hypothetical protein